jgi:hypothetical protein
MAFVPQNIETTVHHAEQIVNPTLSDPTSRTYSDGVPISPTDKEKFMNRPSVATTPA